MSRENSQDCRSNLPEGNVFKFYSQNGLLEMDMDKVSNITFRTAKEIQTERVAEKKPVK